MPCETTPAHCDQNVARLLETAGRDAEAAQRDECVAAPIAEPRITGDDRFAFAALDEVGVGGAFERRLENFSGGAARRPDLGITRFDGFDVGDRVSFSREHEHRRFLGK